MSEEIFINGDADEIQLRVQGHSTQTEALQTWEKNDGTILAQVTSDGRLELGDLDLGTPDALLEVNRDFDSSLPERGLQSLGKISGTISNAIAWAVKELELLGIGGVSGLHTALRGRITQKNTGDANLAELRAADFEAINEGGNETQRVGEMIGVQSTVTNELNGHLDKAVGVKITLNDEGTDPIQLAHGLEIETLPPSAVEAYAVITGADPVGLNETTPSAQLEVESADATRVVAVLRAAASQTANIRETQDNVGNVLEGVDKDGAVVQKELSTTPATPASGQRKIYPKSDGWYDLNDVGTETKLGSGIGAASIDDLTDVDTSTVSPTDGQALVWDDVNGQWKPGNVNTSSAELVLTTQTLFTRQVLFDNTLVSDGTWDEPISQDYDHLEIILLGRTNRADIADTVNVYLNNDTTNTNYFQANHVGGATHSVAVGADPYLGNVPGNTARANTFGQIYALISNYTDTAKEKILRAESTFRYGESLARLHERGVAWENTAAINRIAIAPHVGTNFKAGSRLQIIGIKETTVVTDVSGNVTADLTGVVQNNDFDQAGDVLVGTGVGAFGQHTLTGSNKYLGTDGNGTVGVFDLPSGGVSVQIPAAGLCQGRLTLTSGTPIPTPDVTAATQVYFTPFQGNQLSLYDGTSWAVYALTELGIKLTDTQSGTTTSGNAVVTGLADTSQLVTGMVVSGASMPANTTIQSIDSVSQITLNQNAIATGTNTLTFSVPANTNVDIFCHRSGMTPKLSMVLWPDDTTRAVALALLDGVYVKSEDTTQRYLGTIRTAAAGQTEDSVTRRYVYNEVNKVPRKLRVFEPVSNWTYSINAWRAAHNNTANRVEVIMGHQEMPVHLALMVRMIGQGAGGVQGIAYDTTTGNHADVFPNIATDGHVTSHMVHYPAEGYHYYQWVENARGNSCTMFGYSTSAAYQSGMVGEVTL